MTATVATRARPGVVTIGWERAKFELKVFFREKDAVVFTFAFPVVMMMLLGTIFGNEEIEGTGVKFGQVLVAGIMASGLASTTFVYLAINIATDRDNFELKRLMGTPMPKAAYFLGKVVSVLVIGALEIAIVLAIGVAFFDLALPSSAGRWVTFGWVFVLGLSACTLLGIAMSSVPRSAKSAPAVVNLPFVALQFVSGVWLLFSDIPEGLQRVASLFPLKWMAQGFRSAFLPDGFTIEEPPGSWEHGRTALVLIVWCMLGAVLCALTFRWHRRQDT